MILHIILRTVCGCERIIAIPNRHYPHEYRVPYVLRSDMVLALQGESSAPFTVSYRTRRFERTTMTGSYGFPIYLEQFDERP